MKARLLLLGRGTYEIFAAHWPDDEGPIADHLKFRFSKITGERRWPRELSDTIRASPAAASASCRPSASAKWPSCWLFAVEATRRWAADGITANAVHPGAIADTNLSRYMDPQELEAARQQFTFKTPQQGAATTVLVATSPLLEGTGGRYFEDCNEAAVLATLTPDAGSGVAAYAVDPDNAKRLWDRTLQLVGGTEGAPASA